MTHYNSDLQTTKMFRVTHVSDLTINIDKKQHTGAAHDTEAFFLFFCHKIYPC